MAIVTVAEYKTYAKKLDGDVAQEASYQMVVDAAEAIVTEYLGYDPTSQAYSHTFYGDGESYQVLRARPITALSSLTIAGASATTSDYTLDDDRIVNKYGNPFATGAVVVAGYTAGYATIPGLIKLTVLRIAAILGSESGENIAVTSQSFDGGNTRSFFNHTNFSKFLEPIGQYRLTAYRRLAP